MLNAAPVAVEDLLYYTPANTELNVSTEANGLLGNDFDLEDEIGSGGATGGGGGHNGPLWVEGSQATGSLTLTTQEGGSVEIFENGTFDYTPPTSYVGFDFFTYRAVDASSGGQLSHETLVGIGIGTALTPQLNRPELVGGNSLHTGALELSQTLGGGLELIYRSDTSPVPVVAVETRLQAGANEPDSIDIELDFGGISSGVISLDNGDYQSGDTFRFVQSVNASTLSTGMYEWTMTVTLKYSADPDIVQTFTGRQALVNRNASEFGAGWWLAGLDRLHVDNDGALLENSDGTTFYFADNGNGYDQARGDQTYASLEFNGTGNGYTLTDKWGDWRTFDDDGWITATGRLDIAADYTFSYDANERLETITDISGRDFDFVYNGNGKLDSLTDFASRPTDVNIAYGELRLVEVADVTFTGYTAPVWEFTYQTLGGQKFLDTMTEPAIAVNGAVIEYEFDSATYRLSRIINADSSEWELYPALTQGHVSGAGPHDVFYVRQLNARTVNELDHTYRFATDGFGNVVSSSIAGALGESTYMFDGNGQLVSMTEPDPDGSLGTEYESSITRYGYSAIGNLVLIVNPDDTTQSGVYDSDFNRVTQWTNELFKSEYFTYYTDDASGPDGTLSRYTDAGGIYVEFKYDQYGNVIEEKTQDPDGFGQGATLTALVTTYVYDSSIHTRLNSITVGGDTVQSFTYSTADQIVSVTDYFDGSTSRVASYTYDPLDRILTATLPDPDGTGGPLTSPVYTYTYAANLLLESETDPLGNTTDYAYHSTRHFLTSITLPDPGDIGATNGPLSRPVTSFEYYANGWLHKEYRPEFDNGTTALFIEYSYDALGNITQTDGPLANQTDSFNYDLAGRLETQADASGRVITWKYDSRHRVTQIIDDPDGGSLLSGPTTTYSYDDAGRIEQVTDPLGRFTFYVYYDNGLLAKSLVQDPNPIASGPLGGGGFEGGGGSGIGPTGGDGAVPDGIQATVYQYDNLNRLVDTKDPSGRLTTNVYNQRGQLVEVIDPDPNPDDQDYTRPSTLYERDWQNRILSVTDVLGRITLYELDNLDRITQITLPDPDDNGSLVSPVYTFEYDAVGNLVKTIDSLDREQTTVYDNLYRPISSTERFTPAPFGFGTAPFLATWHYAYNDQLQIASITDPVGSMTTRGYDNAARLITVTEHVGSDDLTTAYSYDLLNRIETVTTPDPDNMAGGEAPLVTTYGYDIYSRLVSIENADGMISQRYNDAGELISITDELENTTTFSYDLLGRLALQTDATGATTSNFYNIHGRLVRQVDRNGQIVWYGQEGYTSSELWFDYGSATPPSIEVATTTQGGGQVNEVQTVTVENAEGGTFRLAFGGETTFHLDYGATDVEVDAALEALHSIDNVLVSRSGTANDGYVYTITFQGDLAGTDVDQLLVDVAAVNDGDVVRIIEYGFDAAGRLLSLADFDPGADLESDTDDTPLAASYTWSYDQLDRLIEQNETIVGLTPQIDLATIWDIVGRRTGLIATIDGNQDYANSYSYDYQNKPLWIYQQGQGTPDSDTNAVAYKRIEFRYNDIGQLTYVNRFETATTSYGTPSLRTVLEYDDANRIVLLSHKAAEHQVGVTVLAQYDFEYDFASRITAIDSFVDGLSEFTFSTTNQLTAADHDASSNNPNEDYQYDANGNRIGTGFVVDAQNRTMSDGVYDYEYDAEGNRTRRTLIADDSYEINTFDHRNRLTKVEFYNSSDVLQQSVTYTYDAFNRLVRRSVDSDGDLDIDRDQFFAGFDGDNSTLEFDGPDDTDLAHRRLWGPFMDQLIASEEVDGLMTEGEVYWPVTDHVGTIRDIGDLDDGMGGSGDFIIVSHRVYSSFGLLTDEYDPATSNPSGVDIEFGFTGRFTDDLTGMTHHLFRWYDPQLGKWISEDPLGFAAGDVNTTRYVGNAPLDYTDPSGLIAVSIDGGNGDADNGGKRQETDDGPSIGPQIGPVRENARSKAIRTALTESDRQMWEDLHRIEKWRFLNRTELGILQNVENHINGTAANIEKIDTTLNNPGLFFVPGSHVNFWDNILLPMGGGRTGRPNIPGLLPSRPTPTGPRLPPNWTYQPTNTGGGIRFIDPVNPRGEGIRFDPAVPGSQWPSQRVPHVVIRTGGEVIGRDGNPLPQIGGEYGGMSHIPLSEWMTWNTWNSPQ